MKTWIVLGVLILASSCNYNKSKESMQGAQVPAKKVTSPAQITYQMVQDSVLKNSCLQCHSAAGGNRGGVNLETYESVFKNKQEVRLEVAGGTMPPRGQATLSDEQIKLITDWIDAGALENGSTVAEQPTPPAMPIPPAETDQLSFQLVFDKVINTNCLKCHSEAGGNKGDVNLETYSNVFALREDIKTEVANGTMPTKRGTPLTPDQKKMILAWIDQGAPEKP